MRSRLSYRFQIDSSSRAVWMSENDAKTLRLEANFFENGEKKSCSQANTDTSGQGLKSDGV